MACGVPTVASDAGGLPELIVHGETGYVAPIGDTESMARYAIRLLTDPLLYKEMSEACIRRAREQFDNEKITDQYEQIYYRVLGLENSQVANVCEVSC